MKSIQQRIIAWWAGLSSKEQQGISWASVLVALTLVWFVLLAPAIRTMQQVPLQRAAFSAQLLELRQMQAQAQALKARPALSRQEMVQLLGQVSGPLGASVKLEVQGDWLRLQILKLDPHAVASLLANVPFQPTDLSLNLAAAPSNGAAKTWSGTMSYLLPASEGKP